MLSRQLYRIQSDAGSDFIGAIWTCDLNLIYQAIPAHVNMLFINSEDESTLFSWKLNTEGMYISVSGDRCGIYFRTDQMKNKVNSV